MFVPSFNEEVTVSGGKGSDHAAMVKMSVIATTSDFESSGSPEFSSVLELWKFLEICLTGETLERWAYKKTGKHEHAG